MNVTLFYGICLSLLLLASASCGPEAETGAVFSRYSAHACAAPSPADTVAPATASELSLLMGKFDPAKHPDFAPVDTPYADKPGMILHRKTLAALQQMWAAAQKDGVALKVISSTRSFDQQKVIWERKWSRFAAASPDPVARARKILEYSAMPGASRHHWGTDIDFNDLNNASFEPGGQYAAVYQWLHTHAHEYGFYQPYTAKDEKRPYGYNEEKWHWSYRPLAAPLLLKYEQTIQDNMITGFQGAETARTIGIVRHYVLGVDAGCK